MKIYTRTGDTGDTGLFGGDRVSKDHRRVEAYGTVDELNAAVGVAIGAVTDPDIVEQLGLVQHDLFAIGAVLATAPPREGRPVPKGVPELPSQRITEMEAWIDAADGGLPPLQAFVLPGGAPENGWRHRWWCP